MVLDADVRVHREAAGAAVAAARVHGADPLRDALSAVRDVRCQRVRRPRPARLRRADIAGVHGLHADDVCVGRAMHASLLA